MDLMTPDAAREFIARTRWTFAKTMPRWPHEYAVRGRQNRPREFLEFARLVRTGEQRGWPERSPRSYLHYLDLDGWTYWTMDPTLEAVTIINRKVLGTSP